METIKANTGSKKATISTNGDMFHVVFWINDEIVSRSRNSKMYATYAGAVRSANAWVGK